MNLAFLRKWAPQALGLVLFLAAALTLWASVSVLLGVWPQIQVPGEAGSWPIFYGATLNIDRFAALFLSSAAVVTLWQLFDKRALVNRTVLAFGFLGTLLVLASTSFTMQFFGLALVVAMGTLAIDTRRVVSRREGRVARLLTGMLLLMSGLLILSGGAFLADMNTIAMVIPQLPAQTLLMGVIGLMIGVFILSFSLPLWLDIVPAYLFYRTFLFLLPTAPSWVLVAGTIIALLIGILYVLRAVRDADAVEPYPFLAKMQLAFAYVCGCLTLLVAAQGNSEALQPLLFSSFVLLFARVFGALPLLYLPFADVPRILRLPLKMTAALLPGTVGSIALWLAGVGLWSALPHTFSDRTSVFVLVVAILMTLALLVGAFQLFFGRRPAPETEGATLSPFLRIVRTILLALVALSSFAFAVVLPRFLTTIGANLADPSMPDSFLAVGYQLVPWLVLLITAVVVLALWYVLPKYPKLLPVRDRIDDFLSRMTAKGMATRVKARSMLTPGVKALAAPCRMIDGQIERFEKAGLQTYALLCAVLLGVLLIFFI